MRKLIGAALLAGAFVLSACNTIEGVGKDDLRQSDFMFAEVPGFVEGISDIGSWYVFPESGGPIA